MICHNCGKPNNEDANFCISCGVQLTPTDSNDFHASTTPTKKEKSFDLPKLLQNKRFIKLTGIGILVLGIIIVISSVIFLSTGDRYMKTEGIYEVFYSKSDDKTLLMYNGKMLDETFAGKCDLYTDYSGDKGVIKSNIGDLFLVTKQSVKKIATGIAKATISPDGSKVAYVTEDDTLYTYTISNKKSEKIADEVCHNDNIGRHFKFSPDGKKILYVTGTDGELTCHIKSGSKTKKLDNFCGLYPNNTDKFIYGMAGGEFGGGQTYFGVYDLKKDTFTKFTDTYDNLLFNSNSVMLNNDYTECIFTKNTDYYISLNGGEETKLGRFNGIEFLTPSDCALNESQHIMPFQTFIGTLACISDRSEYNIGYIDADYEITTILEDIDSPHDYDNGTFRFNDDYSIIYFCRNDTLYRAYKSSGYDPEELASEVKMLEVTSDFKKLYYINNDYELIYLKGKNKEKIIDKNITRCCVKDDTVFFITFGTLYRSDAGKEMVSIADETADFYIRPGYIVYKEIHGYYGDGDYYVSTNYKDFELAGKNLYRTNNILWN